MRTATGIVRRMDDLGRVVIPKELRRTLRIHESDPMEIFTAENGEIILRKYSPITDMLSGEGALLAKVLSQTADVSVIITDKDKIIARWGNLARLVTRGTPPLGPAILQVLNDNVSQSWDNINTEFNDAAHLVAVTSSDDDYPKVSSQYIVPIVDQDETAVGTVVILSDNQSLLSEQLAQADIVAEILACKLSE